MKRVCCLCERWESGGIESFLHNVLTRLDLAGLQVDIVAASLGESVFTDSLQSRGVRFFELSGSPRHITENLWKFSRLLRERRWDVVHLNAFQGLSLSYLHLAKKAGVPVRIAHSHNTALRESLTRPLKQCVHRWAGKRYAGDATDLWACSSNAAEFLFPQKLREAVSFQFIPNGIDVERFRFNSIMRAEIRAELGLKDEFVIGNVGRLCYQKNQEFLLDVSAELLNRNSKGYLLLVGEGADGKSLAERARKLGIADRVSFYGASDRIERLLWAMDAFVMPSRFEGLPVTGVEAQAAGLPCLFSENVTAESGITSLSAFLPLSAGSTAWAEKLLSFQSLQNQREAYAEMVRNAGFDIGTAAAQIEARYKGLSVP